MPSAAFMGMMMMMMVVSLSEQAKQLLSLPLPPKVFFSSFFHLSHPVFLTLVASCAHWLLFTTIRSHPFLSIYLFFLICPFFQPPHHPPLYWYCDRVVVLQFILVHVMMCCSRCHQLVFILLDPTLCFILFWFVFLQCCIPPCFTAIGSEPSHLNLQTRRPVTLEDKKKSCCLVFKLELCLLSISCVSYMYFSATKLYAVGVRVSMGSQALWCKRPRSKGS